MAGPRVAPAARVRPLEYHCFPPLSAVAGASPPAQRQRSAFIFRLRERAKVNQF